MPSELNKGPNKVAVIEIDTDATLDGKGNHFILAYQNTNGSCKIIQVKKSGEMVVN
ncbi:hypothetical protein [Leptospira vanthielii]|uniref:Uncharacterized protein n=1 Tax=Leptospira vanthielii serovar Holland str. Waz Holland = ATCC 700522 TaxID=1218591 RepID=N1WF93_9LEPT|nr:hypothetical protein [Leptospira vanthielii]EMY71902.1 hypothetical protein LEP1GSC199_0099 [Leptospira vanthielii serovar Holland str. Waz Holland = ATCC 700522]